MENRKHFLPHQSIYNLQTPQTISRSLEQYWKSLVSLDPLRDHRSSLYSQNLFLPRFPQRSDSHSRHMRGDVSISLSQHTPASGRNFSPQSFYTSDVTFVLGSCNSPLVDFTIRNSYQYPTQPCVSLAKSC